MSNLFLGLVISLSTSVVELPSVTPKQAARDYRIQVYNTFRVDRDEYDYRIRVGRRVLEQWTRTEQDEAAQDSYVTWFQQATRASSSNNITVLSAGGLPDVLSNNDDDPWGIGDPTSRSLRRSFPTSQSDVEHDATQNEFDLQNAIHYEGQANGALAPRVAPNRPTQSKTINVIGRSLWKSFLGQE